MAISIEEKRRRNNAYMAEYREREGNREKALEYWRRYKYKLEPEEYERLLVSAGGRCMACDDESNETLRIDHCHASENVRGLLCNRCNLVLGSVEDNVAVLEALIGYLREYEH